MLASLDAVISAEWCLKVAAVEWFVKGCNALADKDNVVGVTRAINGGTIGVTAYPMSRVFARPKPLRYTDGDQQLVSAGDRALEFLPSQAQHQDIWPASSWFRQ